MDVRRLLVFRAVAHSGSLAGGARELGLTQPAVSQHVQALEREVRAPLVVRSTRGVLLTDAGRALLEHADAVATRLRAAEQEMAALAGLQAGTVRLVAFPSALATVVPAALTTLRERHPRVGVELTAAEPPEGYQLVQRGAADLAVVFTYDGLRRDGSNLVHHPLGTDPVRVVLPTGHRLASRTVVALADLAEDSWVAGCPRCRDHLDLVCAGAGFAPSIQHGTDDYVVAQALVAQGLAVGLLPQLALDSYHDPGVVVKPSPEAGARHLSVVHHAETAGTPAVSAVVTALRSTV